nr:tRNA wybutosine-synthesizing protein 3 homolog [Anser cygnoides]
MRCRRRPTGRPRDRNASNVWLPVRAERAGYSLSQGRTLRTGPPGGGNNPRRAAKRQVRAGAAPQARGGPGGAAPHGTGRGRRGRPRVGSPPVTCCPRQEDAERRGAPKKGCAWLLVTHEPCRRDELMTALEKATGDVVFKFEPFVLHVLCRELQDAQLLHSVAIDSGFKNSGITVGRGGKIMMAVRSTHCLEVPLSHMGKLMVSEEYIEFLIHVANRKMEENTRRIDRFYKCLRLALEADSANNSPSEETEKYHSVYVHRRKRKTIQEQDVHTSPKDHSEELEPEDDPDSNLGIFAETMM